MTSAQLRGAGGHRRRRAAKMIRLRVTVAAAVAYKPDVVPDIERLCVGVTVIDDAVRAGGDLFDRSRRGRRKHARATIPRVPPLRIQNRTAPSRALR